MKHKIIIRLYHFCIKFIRRVGVTIQGKELPVVLHASSTKMTPYLTNYLYDMERYARNSVTGELPEDFDNLLARITAHYHVLEKGLTLKETRLGFGKEMLLSLINHLDLYVKLGFPKDNEQFLSAIQVIKAYIRHHDEISFNTDFVKNEIEPFLSFAENVSSGGGTIEVNRDTIHEETKIDFEHLAFSRYSVRNFSDEPVDITTIKHAIKIAQKSPSVCNRQASRVYILQTEEAKAKALSVQNGNRGFGHLANKLLIITSNQKYFYGISERNQAYIDGGIFGMSLVYALHSLGLGTCTLNWSVDSQRDKQLRNEIPINDEEVIIFMVAVGHLPPTLKVANSQKRPTESIITVI